MMFILFHFYLWCGRARGVRMHVCVCGFAFVCVDVGVDVRVCVCVVLGGVMRLVNEMNLPERASSRPAQKGCEARCGL